MSRINWSCILNLALLFSLVGCTSFEPASLQPTQIAETPTPLLSPTAVPPYIHYDSSKGPNIHLEFDYPGSWIFSVSLSDADNITIDLSDPRSLSLSTPFYDDHHPIPNDFGNVDIWVMPLQAGQTPDTELESHKKSYNETWWMKVLGDYKTTINGPDASVLEYQVDDQENYTSLMFVRRIFFVIGNNMYEIYFEVAEKDRGGEFEQGYEYFFNSLRVVP